MSNRFEGMEIIITGGAETTDMEVKGNLHFAEMSLHLLLGCFKDHMPEDDYKQFMLKTFMEAIDDY